MKKDVIFRNLERLIYSDSQGEVEPIEPMTEWKWNRVYKLATQYGIGAWVADGIRRYDGNFYLNISPTLRQQFLDFPAEKDPERLARFQLDIDRKVSLARRLSSNSLRTYAHDFIRTVKNIEE